MRPTPKHAKGVFTLSNTTKKINNMSKPKKGYKRWTVDIKEKTAKKAQLIAIKQDSTPKEVCQQILEEHFNGKV